MDQITLPLSYQPKFPGDPGRESATLLVSVCAEGYSSMPPMVIFQSTDSPLGDHDWDNPLRARFWFKKFEKKTRPSGNEEGEYRQLSVRWHRSFINIKLLNYAVKHRVEIGAFGINTNHIVNPLDYACFAPFKARYDKARREYERGTGKRVDKATFLRIIAKPYLETFTIPLIQRAFRETGQWPVHPDIITPRLPIPSRDLGLFASDLHVAVNAEDEHSAGGEPAATPGTH
ncbi:hypothetical protein K474DRAFT_1601665 [Panus rudis PR-1116 ss-1]|nr:hypothetical protein K474DRAFT_1601665 [Panus rudis PR-1116 ss-1]